MDKITEKMICSEIDIIKKELAEAVTRAERAEARLEEANRRIWCILEFVPPLKIQDVKNNYGPVGPEWSGGA